MNRLTWAASACALLLAACASAPPEQAEASPPARWKAPLQAGQYAGAELPHAGNVQQLLDWWRNWNDPLLAELVAAAEEHNPTIASAAARIAQARAGAVAADSALLPQVNAQAGATRSPASTQSITTVPPNTVVNGGQAGVQLQWELDVFGGARYGSKAAQARLQGAQAQWHDARVSLAADTANQYFGLRACQNTLALMQQDATSREETARLTGQLTRAGFAAPATLALAQAGAAQAQAQRNQMEAQCTAAVKALVALTAIDEDTLRQRLQAPRQGRAPALAVDQVPAQVIGQRPDVYAAAQGVAAASGDAGQADAQRYPRLGLGGNIGRVGVNIPRFDTTSYATTWSVGPLSITLPLFDGGRRKAQLQSAQAQYEAAASQYQASVRNAVREVETALTNLYSAQQRSSDTALAERGFQKNLTAANAKYKAGMGSMLELEDARRNWLGARMNQIRLQQETEGAWVALYRALGGGWQLASNNTDADKALLRKGEQARAASKAARSAPAASPAASSPEPRNNEKS